jgi:hypothetical protein
VHLWAETVDIKFVKSITFGKKWNSETEYMQALLIRTKLSILFDAADLIVLFGYSPRCGGLVSE